MNGYADELVAEAKRAHGQGALPSAQRTAHLANAVCGDEVDIDVVDDGSRIVDVGQRTRGCVFTRASASILARTTAGLTLAEARDLATVVQRDLARTDLPGELAMLGAVRLYPARRRCALLPWDALRLALDEA